MISSCPNCGSLKLRENIKVGVDATDGHIGLEYRGSFFAYYEHLKACLCQECGHVELKVENTFRNWVDK